MTSKDKKQIVGITNNVLKNNTLLEHLLPKNSTFEDKVAYFQKNKLSSHYTDFSIQRWDIAQELKVRYIRMSTSRDLENLLLEEYGVQKTEEILSEAMKEPLLTIRCNPLQIDRKKVLGI